MRTMLALSAMLLLAACPPSPEAPKPSDPREAAAVFRRAVQNLTWDGVPKPPAGSQIARTKYVEVMMDAAVRAGLNVGAVAKGATLSLTFVDASACDDRFLAAAANLLREPLRYPGFDAIACEPEGRSVSFGAGE